MNSKSVIIFFLFLFRFTAIVLAQNEFTEADRKLLIEINVRQNEMEKRLDGRIDQLDKNINARMDQVDNNLNARMDQMDSKINNLSMIFVAIVVGIFGFAIWDRRTMTKPFELKVKVIEDKIEVNKKSLESLLLVLREQAKSNTKIAGILKQFNLL